MLYVKVEELQHAIDLIKSVNDADLEDIMWVSDTKIISSKEASKDEPRLYEDWQFIGLCNKDFAIETGLVTR
jgi:hypothetical protein